MFFRRVVLPVWVALGFSVSGCNATSFDSRSWVSDVPGDGHWTDTRHSMVGSAKDVIQPGTEVGKVFSLLGPPSDECKPEDLMDHSLSCANWVTGGTTELTAYFKNGRLTSLDEHDQF